MKLYITQVYINMENDESTCPLIQDGRACNSDPDKFVGPDLCDGLCEK